LIQYDRVLSQSIDAISTDLIYHTQNIIILDLGYYSAQLIDNNMFTLIAFYGHIPVGYNSPNYVTSLMLKVIVSFTDTPFLYGTRSMKPEDD